MSVTLLLVLLVVFAFIAGHLVNRYASRFVALSGAEYLLVGALIGPQLPPRLVTTESLEVLRPLVSLMLGLVGFLVGMRIRDLLTKPRRVVAGTLYALGVVVFVGAGVLVVLAALVTPADAHPIFRRVVWTNGKWVVDIYVAIEHVWPALAIGAAACASSTALVVSTGESLGARSEAFRYLRTVATVGQIVAILTLGIELAVVRSTAAATRLGIGVTSWAAAAVLAGVVCGLLFTLFIGRESQPNKVFLAAVGAVIFASGVGAALGLSPLFVNLIAGVTVAITSPHAAGLREELDRLQHAIFVLLMILAGALWTPAAPALWLVPVAYIFIRWVALRLLAGGTARAIAHVDTPRLGNGLLSQGTLAVAVAVDFSQRFAPHAAVVLTTVITGAILSDIRAQKMLRAVLVDAEAMRKDASPADSIEAVVDPVRENIAAEEQAAAEEGRAP